MSEKTWFGYTQVEASEKESLVKGVFSSVASRYDLMNDVMSFGLHRLWKDTLIRELSPRPGSSLLDVAGGTGDIAFRFLKSVPDGHVTVCDINPDMLMEGRKRAIDHALINKIQWQCGNAESLPFPDDHFDYYTIAFGIRNVTHIDRALQEAWRVLKPGGKCICLEFSHVDNPALARAYDYFSFQIIPAMGKWVAGDTASYRYLVESIRKFPSQRDFQALFDKAGFVRTGYRSLSQGIVALHWGWKI